jgi:hypothetical protein
MTNPKKDKNKKTKQKQNKTKTKIYSSYRQISSTIEFDRIDAESLECDGVTSNDDFGLRARETFIRDTEPITTKHIHARFQCMLATFIVNENDGGYWTGVRRRKVPTQMKLAYTSVFEMMLNRCEKKNEKTRVEVILGDVGVNE